MYVGSSNTVDPRFMWNFNMSKPFVAQRIPPYWVLPLIQGYVDYSCPVDGLEMILIARRKWAMGGTRFNARGIDDEANCANHTELEQLVFKHSILEQPKQIAEGQAVISTTQIFSYVQVRGSMPFFWDQTGVKTINISRPNEVTMPVFKKHFADLRKDYNDG